MVIGQYEGELGFGIRSGVLSSKDWQDAPAVYVNADTGEYVYKGVVYDDYARMSLS